MTQVSTDELLTAAYRGDRSAIDAYLETGGDLDEPVLGRRYQGE